MRKTIALVTDFGSESAYPGIMKGVIWSLNPHVNIADLTHGIAPWDLTEAFYILEESFDYFPVGTIFCAVVDPGVGSDRRIIALKYKCKTIIVPDNGLARALSSGLGETPEEIYSIKDDSFFLKKVSATFHGRDIFAPAAAWLSMGADIKNLGERIDPESLIPMSLDEAMILPDGSVSGKVVRIDRFGNLVTNIREGMLEEIKDDCLVRISDHGKEINGISEYYSQGSGQEPLAIIGSSGYLEICVNRDNAARVLSVSRGEEVIVKKL